MIVVLAHPLSSQEIKHYSASDIYEELEKFNFLGSALYLAAHPDDENTRLISYMSNHLHARTAYLSMTTRDCEKSRITNGQINRWRSTIFHTSQ